MDAAAKLTVVSAGVFFLTGLITGVIKYRQIAASDSATAHPYIDIGHRASLLYAFACILLLTFVEISRLPVAVELAAVAALVLYFAASILTYVVHGLLQDTDNQLKCPFRLGNRTVPGSAISIFMWTLIAAEIGGFLVLFYGVLLEVF
ncbi:hypothetical protein HFP89_13430 [Wenzhouxiangella sp. XN79A]|uniref:hypothetical protein n=1 Tax=Wenzhouxiangella sp. XN79A TaxID=2724193 RepID=UPI00144A9CD2|nr:hypothetical protein [Wenzhouxiangella sp. XN79A]NKI36167.1 hypothetical protein [Wenzhouxiangella sp. XN79A]